MCKISFAEFKLKNLQKELEVALAANDAFLYELTMEAIKEHKKSLSKDDIFII